MLRVTAARQRRGSPADGGELDERAPIHIRTEGLRPSDSPTRSLARSLATPLVCDMPSSPGLSSGTTSNQ
jgi:hypothetical protein